MKKKIRCGWCPRAMPEAEFDDHVYRMHGERLDKGEVCNAREAEPEERKVRVKNDVPGQKTIFEVI